MSNIIGLEGLVYALLTTESATTASNVYGTVTAIAPAVKASIKPKTSDAKLYGDNVLKEHITTLEEIEIEIETTEVSNTVIAALLGQTIATDILTQKQSDVAPLLALGFKAKKSNGEYRMVWLVKGKFQPVDESYETIEGKVNFQTQKIKGTFYARLDGVVKYSTDDDSSSTFLATVYKP